MIGSIHLDDQKLIDEIIESEIWDYDEDLECVADWPSDSEKSDTMERPPEAKKSKLIRVENPRVNQCSSSVAEPKSREGVSHEDVRAAIGYAAGIVSGRRYLIPASLW